MNPRIKTLGIRDQAAWVRSRNPGFRCEVNGGLLSCRGQLQPGPVCATYDVVIEYRVGTWPKAYVPGNQLKPLEPGGKIPHTYGPTQPCLFYPSRAAWRSDMKLSETIIPWLSLWLMFYEMWRVTGEWDGGGIAHDGSAEIEPAA
jgi:hypothetical protein